MGACRFYIAREASRFDASRSSMPNSAPPREAVSVLSQAFRVNVPCALSVDVPGARLRIRPSSASEQVDVDVSVTNCSPEEAEEIPKRLGLSTRQRKNTVHVYADSDRLDAEWWRWVRAFDATLHVDLRLPPHIEADVQAPGGSIDIADLQGHVDLKAIGGPCRVADLAGTLDIRAESSDVSVHGFSGDQIAARVAVGSLTLENIEADAITVRSMAAPLTLSSMTGPMTVAAKSATVELQALSGPCTARVEGGPLRYDGAPDDELELQVVGGSLETVLPPDHGADLCMTGSTLALADSFSFDGERTEHEIEGLLNGGGPPLSLHAPGGNVDCQPA